MPLALPSLSLSPSSTPPLPSLTCALHCPHFEWCSRCTHQFNLHRPVIVDEATEFFKTVGVSDFTFDSCKLLNHPSINAVVELLKQALQLFRTIAQKLLLSNILDPSLTLLALMPQRCYNNNCKYKLRGRSYSFCGAAGVFYHMWCFSLYDHMKLQMQIFLKVHDDPSNTPV